MESFSIYYVVLFIGVIAFCIWWPLTHYESDNPYLRGEDFWIPFRDSRGQPFNAGPDLFFFLHREDHALRRKVQRHLRKSAPEHRDVIVRVARGEVYLRGHAPTEEDKLRIKRLCREVDGAARIHDQLTVQALPDWIREG